VTSLHTRVEGREIHLSLIEPELVVAADLRDDRVKIVDHNILLCQLIPCVGAVSLPDRLLDDVANLVEEGFQVLLLRWSRLIEMRDQRAVPNKIKLAGEGKLGERRS
jgi:hypothetical protein